MSILFVYNQTLCFAFRRNIEEIFVFISFVFFILFCSSLLFFYNMVSIATFIYGWSCYPSQDLCSPYHVRSYHNHSFFIVNIILEGANYHHWSHSFQMSLISKNNIGFIDETIKASPLTNLLFTAWQKVNMLVVSSMFKVVSPSLLYCDDDSTSYNKSICFRSVWNTYK